MDHKIGIDDIRSAVDARTFERGYEYWRRKRVVSVEPTGNGVSARVQGSDFEPYEIELSVSLSPPKNERPHRGIILDGYCSCPMEYNCKHVVAVALAAFEGQTAKPGIESVQSHDRYDGIVDQWLSQFSETLQSLHGERQAAITEQLFYLMKLDSPHGFPELTVSAARASRRKDGSFGKPRPYSIENLSYGNARWMTPLDATIGRLLNASALLGSQRNKPRPEALDVILDRLIATKRCRWDSWDGPILTRGENRMATITWDVGEDGRQRIALNANDKNAANLRILPATPPWYVNLERAEAGRLDLGVPAEIAGMLSRAPALSSEQAGRTKRLWETQLRNYAVPAPRMVIDESVVDEDPIPCLFLQMREMIPRFTSAAGIHGYVPPADVGIASLTFDYGGTIVEPADNATELRSASRDAITRRLRRFEFEERALLELEKSGFEKVIDLRRTILERGIATELGFPLPENAAQQRWAAFLDRTVPVLRDAGWHITIDADFPFQVVRLDAMWQAEVTHDDENHWFAFALDVEVAAQRIPLLPVIVEALRRYGRGENGIDGVLARDETVYGILPNGTFAALPAQRVRAILDNLVELFDGETLTGDGSLRMTLAQTSSIGELDASIPIRWSNGRIGEFIALLRETRENVRQPRHLRAELRPYQRSGFNWLQLLRTYGFGGILADDMGLGKTVQTLAHLLAEKQACRLNKPCLIVAPTSVVPNWHAEIRKFAPSLRVVVLHGPDRSKHFRTFEDYDIVLTSYALLARDAEAMLEQAWEIIVLDEAQAIKNPHAKITSMALQLEGMQRLALTGTPMENHLEELWSLCTFVMPGILGRRDAFVRHFRTPIEKHANGERQRLLASRLRPFMLRRTKTEVDEQLPEKTEIVQRFELTGAQRDLYETVRLAMHRHVQDEIEKKGFRRSHIVVLSALLKLRQVCCDPRLVGLPKAKAVKESAKRELLFEMLPELLDEGRRVLLFSQFTSMLDLLKPELEKRKIPFVELRGETRDRETPVRRFQNREVPLFLISLKAGGTGLNLTAADTVIHYDPWWNPAVERQATDRAHRIGQKQHVFVYKLIASGTVEDRILEMQARKGALADALFDESSKIALDTDDIERLFAPIQ